MKLSFLKIVMLFLVSFGGQLIAQQQRNLDSKVTKTEGYLKIEYRMDTDWIKATSEVPKAYQFILNNSEGKFESFQVVTDQIPFEFIDNEMNRTKGMTASLLIKAYEDYIELVIESIMKKEKEYNSIRFYTQSKAERFNAGEEDWYRGDRNNLIYYLQINDKIEIQLGHSVEPDLNATYISELDKTVFNSLNLLALNY